ncbi:acyltransferase [Bradyrhizobium sp. CIAT3101]|uniref:acyltransferase family protein n=1 Tax=Bradyrhizobium sp. CIAT3101 TaxID=439387 RepID=UPI0024B1E5E5|nr:acyltransferase [Bradyrhizobium sp. CIAT3101]WFU79118.1 acyltransferase [Bradyrhizobium sp. CIAT3101]
MSENFRRPTSERHTPRAADILTFNKGTGPGFDVLRLLLSIWVFTIHAMFICDGPDAAEAFAADPVHGLLVKPVLPMFFIVSGYLVTGSAVRTKDVSVFLLFRALRILPALFAEIALSALILGPLLTEKPIGQYFSDPLFAKYFLNTVGHVQFFLPGLFLQNPVAGVVNLNLWTLKPEFFCYLFIACMIATKAVFSKNLCSLMALLTIALITLYVLRGGQVYNFVDVPDWKILIASFILGSCAFHWNDRLVLSGSKFSLALLVAVVAAMQPFLVTLGLLALVYVVVFVGMRKFAIPQLLRDGDYSYGIYLFGFPIQQTLVYLLPLEYRHGSIILLAGLPATFAFAALSWNLIEKPAASLKTKFRRGYSAVANHAARTAPNDRLKKKASP